MAPRKLSSQEEAVFAALLLLSLFVLGVSLFGHKGCRGLNEKQQELQSLRSEAQKLEAANFAMKDRLKKLESDPRTQEMEIRKKLNYVRPDELIYQVPEKGGRVSGKTP